MGIVFRISFFIVLYVSTSMSFAQINYQQKYKNGKDLFQLGKYELAMQEFKDVTAPSRENPFDVYASYYYAVSAFRSGSKELARTYFSRLAARNSDWNKIDEVYYWLGYINLELKNYNQALQNLERLQDDSLKSEADKLKYFFLTQEKDEIILTDLLESYNQDQAVAYALALVIASKPLLEKDFGKLESLVEDFQLDPAEFNLVLSATSVKKDRYNVAVLLPFMYRDMQPVRGRRSNQFILDIYEGIQIAVDELKEEGTEISLFAYDTKRSSVTTDSILSLDELKNMDLIIGPLFPGPVERVSQFAYGQRINMVNPLSTNAKVIGNSPFNFLMNPVSEHMALKAAKLTVDSLQTNKNALIYYEDNSTDSLIAYTYKQAIELDSFNVVSIQMINEESNNRVFTSLASTVDVFELEQHEQDSLLRLYDVDELDRLQVYQMQPDSIGHIFVASDAGIIASNIISAVNARPDTIKVIGFSRWLEYPFIDYGVVENLGCWFISPDYIDLERPAYRLFLQTYVNQHKVLPSDNLLHSYDMMMLLGRSLEKYGTFFQHGIRQEGLITGDLREGFDFSLGNYNSYVPIIQLRESKVVIVNDPTSRVLLNQEKASEDR